MWCVVSSVSRFLLLFFFFFVCGCFCIVCWKDFVCCTRLPFMLFRYSCSVMSNSLRPHGLKHSQASLSFTISWSLLKFIPLNWWYHPAISFPFVPFSCLQSLPASRSYNESVLPSGGQSIVDSASVLPMNIQDWFPLGLTGLISLMSKGLSGVFSNTKSINSLALNLLYGSTLPSIHNHWKHHSFDYTDLYQQSNVSAF